MANVQKTCKTPYKTNKTQPKPKPEPATKEHIAEEAPPPPQQQKRVKATAPPVNPLMSRILSNFSENTIDKGKKGLLTCLRVW